MKLSDHPHFRVILEYEARSSIFAQVLSLFFGIETASRWLTGTVYRKMKRWAYYCDFIDEITHHGKKNYARSKRYIQ